MKEGQSRSLRRRAGWASQSRWQWPARRRHCHLRSMKRLCPTRRKKSKPWAENASAFAALFLSRSVGDMYEQIVIGSARYPCEYAALVQTEKPTKTARNG